MTLFQRVYDLLGNEQILVRFACSKGEDIKAGDSAVAQKFAALAAAHAAAYTHVFTQYGTVSETNYIRTLRKIASNTMTESLARLADYMAHVTWLSGQPFRGSDKIPRIAAFTFDTLSPEDLAKDREHVVYAAKFLADWLDTEPASVAA